MEEGREAAPRKSRIVFTSHTLVDGVLEREEGGPSRDRGEENKFNFNLGSIAISLFVLVWLEEEYCEVAVFVCSVEIDKDGNGDRGRGMYKESLITSATGNTHGHSK